MRKAKEEESIDFYFMSVVNEMKFFDGDTKKISWLLVPSVVSRGERERKRDKEKKKREKRGGALTIRYLLYYFLLFLSFSFFLSLLLSFFSFLSFSQDEAIIASQSFDSNEKTRYDSEIDVSPLVSRSVDFLPPVGLFFFFFVFLFFCCCCCCWLLVVGCWLLVVGCWLLVVVVCFVLFCFVLFCFVLFCFVLFCFVLFCFVLFCFVLFCFVFCLFCPYFDKTNVFSSHPFLLYNLF